MQFSKLRDPRLSMTVDDSCRFQCWRGSAAWFFLLRMVTSVRDQVEAATHSTISGEFLFIEAILRMVIAVG